MADINKGCILYSKVFHNLQLLVNVQLVHLRKNQNNNLHLIVLADRESERDGWYEWCKHFPPDLLNSLPDLPTCRNHGWGNVIIICIIMIFIIIYISSCQLSSQDSSSSSSDSQGSGTAFGKLFFFFPSSFGGFIGFLGWIDIFLK